MHFDLFRGQINEVVGETSIAFYSDWVPQIDSRDFNFSTVEFDSTKHLHTFAVADIASLQLNDFKEAQPTKIAFWWITLDKAPKVPVKGNSEHLVEMKLWTDNATLANLYQKNGMNCELAKIGTKYSKNSSFIELKSINTHFQLSLQGLDPMPEEVEYDVPIFMTIWPFSKDLKYYQLYTFYGHEVQYATKVDFKILDEKETNFTKVLKESYENSQVYGNLQSNWRALFGLYKKN